VQVGNRGDELCNGQLIKFQSHSSVARVVKTILLIEASGNERALIRFESTVENSTDILKIDRRKDWSPECGNLVTRSDFYNWSVNCVEH